MTSPWPFQHVASEFCRLSGDVLTAWEFQNRLHRHWKANGPLANARLASFFSRVNNLVIDHWFLAVARLHDPESTIGSENLSIKYILARPEITEKIISELQIIEDQMVVFYEVIKAVRHKFLAHNDLYLTMTEKSAGEFP